MFTIALRDMLPVWCPAFDKKLLNGGSWRFSVNAHRVNHLGCAIVLCFAVFVLPLSAQPPPKREFRGVWISTVANIDWPPISCGSVQEQKESLIALLDRLHAAGFNAVVFQVRSECDAMYPSRYEPWSHYLTGNQGQGPSPPFDPLQLAIDAAHARGMELHAWINPYRAVRVVGLYPLSPLHVSRVHPAWILTVGSLKMLDPGLEEVRSYVTKIVLDVARRYDVDGIHIDDYFYASGISTQDDASYARNPRGFTLKTDWRRDNVNLLLKAISDSVKAIKPWVKFGVSPAGIYRDGMPALTSGRDNYSVIHCDPIAWLDGGYVDYLSPQLYWKFGGPQDFALLEPWWRDSVAAHRRAYYPGLATFRIGDPRFGGTEQIARQIRFNRLNAGGQGTIQFTANSIASAPSLSDTLRLSLYRYPALVPTMPWKSRAAPYPPRGIRYAPKAAGGTLALLWDLPLVGPAGDSACRYVVYRFDHRPGISDFASAEAILSVVGSRSFIPPVPPEVNGPYYYAVTALSRNSVEGDTSNILVLSPPRPPTPLAPLEMSSEAAESARVIWHSTALAVAYQLQLATDSLFVPGSMVSLPALTDTSHLFIGFRAQRGYYWRVRAYGGGGIGHWSQVVRFRTGLPTAPAPIYPPDIQGELPLLVDLRWNASASLTSLTYRVQISRSWDFSDLLADTSGVCDTTFRAPALDSRASYLWRVRAENSLGASAWSSARRFATVTRTFWEEGPPVPEQFTLGNGIRLPAIALVRLSDSSRRELAQGVTLAHWARAATDEKHIPEQPTIPWNRLLRASGVYFLHMRGSRITSARKKRRERALPVGPPEDL
ncbi:MAG TPA: family 10 glycosylhydrolase [Bacteroidota bacterium]|nr:family 10 glycosylhydrolase [Bacteroidota bacterium]